MSRSDKASVSDQAHEDNAIVFGKLFREKKSFDARLKRVDYNVKKFCEEDEIDDVDIQSELESLQNIWNGYLNVHKRMVNVCADSEVDTVLDEMSNFEEKSIELKTTLLKLLRRVEQSSTPHGSHATAQVGADAIQQLAEQQAEFLRIFSSTFTNQSLNATNATANSDVKLPRVNIPIFSRNFLEWQSFIDLFESSVDNNASLQDGQKLYFLKSNLAGEAASLISHLRIEDANYSTALQKLKERYNRPLEIAAQHIRRFLKQQTLTSATATGLRSLHDTSDETIRALKAMQREDRDVWLMFIIEEKLDHETRQQWYQKRADMDINEVTFDHLLKFVDTKGTALQSLQPIRSQHSFAQNQNPKFRSANTLVSSTQNSDEKVCQYCYKLPHSLYQCGKFFHASPKDRLSFVRKQNLCFNCLKAHRGQVCTSSSCRTCGKSHHTRLHEAFTSSASPDQTNRTPSQYPNLSSASQSLISSLTLVDNIIDTNVLLLTATVNVYDRYGRPQATDISQWPIPDAIHLADPQFHHPNKISLLLGNKLFFELLEPGTIRLSADDSLPLLQNTKLGSVVSGGFKEANHSSESAVSSCLLASSTDDLNNQLRKFWELEQCNKISPHFTDEELRCEEHFTKYTTRESTGQFVVRLPFSENPSALGNSREIAVKRLLHLERKLNRNPHLKRQYHDFLSEYAQLRHMSLATTPAPNGSVYLPHHCDIKEASSTTKCRVVFDASAKTSTGRSLNDNLLTGPVLQDSLINILLRFRSPAVVLTGDIQQMYRMVLLHENDRECQRILWRWSPDSPIEEYRLNTVTYGTKSASYLATKCVRTLLLDHQDKFPEATQNALNGMYIDNVLVGADTEENAKLLRKQLCEVFSAENFHLRKWASNSVAALEGVPIADLEAKVPIELDSTNSTKTLGIHWQPCSDELLFSYFPTEILQPTKRIILSQIASLFDPLGLLAPIVIKAKLVMQRLWELRVAWDSTPPVPRRVIRPNIPWGHAESIKEQSAIVVWARMDTKLQ
ncbi:uncharacterized protein LOC129773346 [Toxorhynchites rutilus septentrionalis]|uniref:uncharacterized protein LOC129773346 n=1 Tax=Toxorhynchites rutilus septentrionalis TaxID=329112 RepID=UPI00247AD4AF|nr:uncharacterized protein LOC129773346 [Toxorhynchites rutilus septentrionalis]